MAKFGVVSLSVGKEHQLNLDNLREPELRVLSNSNIIYIYRGSKSKKIYIGQSVNFLSRHSQHYSGTEEKFNVADFDQVIVLYSTYFNGSALDDVESQLITYFTADNPKAKHQAVYADDYNNIINQTAGNSVNEYTEREKVATEVVLPFWEDVLGKRGWVNTPNLDLLRTKALVKYSPIKKLTRQQHGIIDEILDKPAKSFVINGDAGTGKTVLLTHLVAELSQKKPDAKIAIVVQPNWVKTAEEIFKVYGLNSANVVVGTSIKLVNYNKDNHIHYDTIIVDESHKLSRRGNKQHPSFNKVYEGKFSDEENHLEILKKLGDQIVLMYDVLQAIRPANISRTSFKSAIQDFERRYLTTQFRIQAPAGKDYNSDDYINGIKYLLYKDTGLLAETNFNPDFNRDVFRDGGPDAYFGYFKTEPLRNLFDWIEEDRNFNPENVDRVLAGLVEDWKQSDGKSPAIKHWFEGSLAKRWNSTQENWVNSKDNDAEDQVGSVFAVQGIDLNRVGVLIGDDIQVNDKGILVANKENFRNVNGKFSEEDMQLTENQEEFTLFVLNIYYILLTRGIDGIRLGFWRNDAFIEYMERTLEINS
ncbi:DUF2075 domain-containing protein [uncultured Fructobacillus sp.]|uniref:DUF2075 domain-containing protein n=1 Tax=uncultured Fructobacillus sp. TaxID=591942 RepID=UPI002592CC2E|nr:DUF2075 domain-containing protein [uncultured Fructobacillus sp.]